MQLLPTEPAPPKNAIQVYRQSWLVALACSSIMVVLLIGVPVGIWYAGKLPNWVAVIIAVFAAIVVPMIYGQVYAALLRSNWIVAYGPEGIWINLRSHRNYRFEPANTVLQLAFDEVGGVFEDSVRRSEETSDGTAVWRESSLCLQLSTPEVDPLKRALAKERKATSTTTLFGGLITTSGRSNHTPVHVSRRGLIRVVWRSRYDFVRPGLRQVLHELSQYIPLQGGSDSTEAAWRTLSDKQFDDRIVSMVEAGETLAAVKLLKQRKGLSITQAKKFVNELTGQLPV